MGSTCTDDCGHCCAEANFQRVRQEAQTADTLHHPNTTLCQRRLPHSLPVRRVRKQTLRVDIRLRMLRRSLPLTRARLSMSDELAWVRTPLATRSLATLVSVIAQAFGPQLLRKGQGSPRDNLSLPIRGLRSRSSHRNRGPPSKVGSTTGGTPQGCAAPNATSTSPPWRSKRTGLPCGGCRTPNALRHTHTHND